MPNLDWKNLGFKYMDTHCHIEYQWRDGKWDEGRLVESPYMQMHMAAACLHYGQECFEGMKVFRQKSGRLVVFRPEDNAVRMQRTAVRTCMPPVPTDIFLEAIRRVVKANEDFVPPYGTGGSLYIRPLLIGTAPQIGVAPADYYTFVIMVVPAGAYYKGGLKPVRAIILDDYDRAAPLGMGDVKVGGNYAASIYAHEKAKHMGFPVELYLDAKTHTHVEEFATSNFFGIKKNADSSVSYVTPDSRSVLPSVTNLSLKQIAADLGWKVEVRPVPFEEIPEFAEIGACGTAVVVTPVSEVVRGDTSFKFGDGESCGECTMKLYKAVQDIQYGEAPDIHNWCVEI